MSIATSMARHVPSRNTVPWERPAPSERAFSSRAIEARIEAAAARIADPQLRRLLENALPNTLDTTIVAAGTDERPDTFVLTGDIHAMWLRDSTAQVWPYLSSVAEDAALDRLIRGVIRRQSEQVLLDPYANAFLYSPEDGTEWAGDETDMRPGVHERKWEPDSLAAFLRLSAGYWRASGSTRPFDAQWKGALELVLRTLRCEQRMEGATPYRFHRPHGDPTDMVPNGGRGAPTRPNGMVHGAFRPSDDACGLPLNVPVNLALAAALEQAAPLAEELGASDWARQARALAGEIRAGVARDGIAGQGWAYEVDGLGGRIVMDDANAPSLLSLPYLGGCRPDDPRYLSSRRWILSRQNPWWFSGSAAEGVGSPHTGPGRIWPIAIALQGLTSGAAFEKLACARRLAGTHAGTYLAHESFAANDPGDYTRPWFAWANSLVGEFLESMAIEGLLKG
ncbi:MAG TPA: glycoside hydrolase family 125 protein [Devosia sp.]|nr:glycoside hydrolase family 125 protein [Devosia sp.]